MKIIALMLVRNEDWVIEASLEAALRWCDGVAVMLDRCTDETFAICQRLLWASGKPSIINHHLKGDQWDEMDLRQVNLEDGRAIGGTHFAIIDADEMLTHNNLSSVREWFAALAPGEILNVPMIAARSLDQYQHDSSVWSSAILTLGFKDREDLTWKPAVDGYQHHNRPPRNHQKPKGEMPIPKRGGGVFHLQFANTRRLLAKHILYRMVDFLRWPGRETLEDLNKKYDAALQPPLNLRDVPPEWWGDYLKDKIVLDGVPWQEAEIKFLLKERGPLKFDGLDLKGFTA